MNSWNPAKIVMEVLNYGCVYERIEKFAEVFNIDWETCEFIDDSGEDWAEN